MKTVILPGYYPRNEDWARQTKKDLRHGCDVEIHRWQHWSKKGASFNKTRELEAIYEEIGKETVNIIAKSVGTRIAMDVINKFADQVNKLILCGIPTKGESESAKRNYSPLSGFDASKVVVIQNNKDPLADYKSVEKFIKSINPSIKVIKKKSSKHHYPYSSLFKNVIEST